MCVFLTIKNIKIFILYRSKDETFYTDIPCSNIKEPITPHQICKFIQPEIKIKLLNPILIPTVI